MKWNGMNWMCIYMQCGSTQASCACSSNINNIYKSKKTQTSFEIQMYHLPNRSHSKPSHNYRGRHIINLEIAVRT